MGPKGLRRALSSRPAAAPGAAPPVLKPSAPTGEALVRWLPAVLWALLVVWLSTDAFSGERTRALIMPVLRALLPGADLPTLEAIHDVLRKLAHPSEYAVLGWLVHRAFDLPARPARTAAARALLLCASFAALDELHQAFVPSRGAAVADTALDSLGAAAGLTMRALRVRVRRLSAGRRSRA